MTLVLFMRKLADREPRMKKFSIRLLVRDHTRPFLVPCGAAGEEDADYRKVTISRNIRFIDDFRADINQLVDSGAIADVRFEVRLHRFEPLFKGILIIGRTGFWGLYPMIKARRSVAGEQTIIWDYYGKRARLVGLRNDGPHVERELLSSFSDWFETVWDHFSIPADEVERSQPRHAGASFLSQDPAGQGACS